MPNTREKQLELVEVINNYFGVDAAYFDVDAFTLAKQIMEAGWTKQKWIPVTEMYPRLESYIYSVDVMFLLASGDVRIGYVNYESERWKCRESRASFDKEDVTHWMPLPEPPKGE